MRLCLAVLLLLCCAAPAGAATATVKTTPGDITVVAVELAAGTGERNDVEVRISGTEVTFRDTGKNPVAGSGCVVVLDTARCTVAPASADSFTALEVTVRGGDGSDRVRFVRPSATPPGHLLVILAGDGGAGTDDLGADTPAVKEDIESDGALVIGILEGGEGDDVVTGGEGNDFLAGGPGRDRLTGGAGADGLGGDRSGNIDAFLTAFTTPEEQAEGAPKGPPEVPGDDVLDGGAGEDTADYSGRADPVKVDLANPAGDGSPGESDALTGIENVTAGDGANELRGDDAVNRLVGGDGDDRMEGRAGNDELLAGWGLNVLDGGAGDDILEGPATGSHCGAGTDTVRWTRLPLDGASLRRDCELAGVGGIINPAALRLRAVRRSGRSLLLDAVAYRSPLGDSYEGKPLKVTIAKPGGKTIATTTVDLPKTTKEGVDATLRLKLSARARRTVRSLKRVRLTFSSPGVCAIVDLPLR
jgi:Ca2+-binding RTX toxin-like protein